MSDPTHTADPAPGVFGARLESPAWLLCVYAIWLAATLGLRPLMLPDEGRYASVAREMLLGDALLPTLNSLPFFHKPPLFYWIDIAAMHLFGENVFAVRMPSMLGAWLMGASLLLSLRRWHGPRPATIALAVLATCPFLFVGAQFANHDMLVAGLITAAVLALARALDEPPRVQLRWLVAGAVACALAVLAKGLIGIVLPALIIGPWLIAQGRWRQAVRLMHPLGLLAFITVMAPWFIAMQMRYPGFYDYFFIEQHFRRFAQSNFNNVHPFWFFTAVLPVLTLPWSAWFVQAVRAAWNGRDRRIGLYIWWVVAVVGFFSLPSSKLVGYVMPALAPWCGLLALAFSRAPGRSWPWVTGGSGLLCVVIVASLALWQEPRSNQALGRALGAQMAPHDRVVMVDEYFYDLPFYAWLKSPAIVASDWTDPELPRRDNWRKELFDAARFDAARGRALLRPLDAMDALMCGTGSVWFVVRPGDVPRVASLAGSARVLANSRTELWRAPAQACP